MDVDMEEEGTTEAPTAAAAVAVVAEKNTESSRCAMLKCY